ncbi:MAG TPA: flagellar FlbD family protein [Terriglobales bacterium]|nr:flagellar FlbD family protein [Terriglobales bacterium]
MIQLTRLNNQPLTINSDLIKFVEKSPDTLITLLNGEKILVRESPVQVRNRIIEFRRAVLQGIFPLRDQLPAVAAAIGQSGPAAPAQDDEGQSER